MQNALGCLGAMFHDVHVEKTENSMVGILGGGRWSIFFSND